MEKPNLLRPRPMQGARTECGCETEVPDDPSARRPADVYLPRLGTRGPTAFNFVVTSGLQSGMIARSATDASHAANAYAEKKRSFLNTAQQCHEEGITFVPMIVEGAGGGWGADAERIWTDLSRAISATSREETSSVAADLYQSLSLILHREGARGVLHRLSGTVDQPDSLASARAVLSSVPEDDAYGN